MGFGARTVSVWTGSGPHGGSNESLQFFEPDAAKRSTVCLAIQVRQADEAPPGAILQRLDAAHVGAHNADPIELHLDPVLVAADLQGVPLADRPQRSLFGADDTPNRARTTCS